MRRRKAPKRKILPDPKYRNLQVAKVINILMSRGKKSVAEAILYRAFTIIAEKTGQEPVDVFKTAVDNARPLVETKSRRVGGATYQVPIEVRTERGTTLAMRWMKDFARSRKGRPMDEKFAQEIMDCYNKTGSTYKKREDLHRMAEANKAFSHYRW